MAARRPPALAAEANGIRHRRRHAAMATESERVLRRRVDGTAASQLRGGPIGVRSDRPTASAAGAQRVGRTATATPGGDGGRRRGCVHRMAIDLRLLLARFSSRK